MRGLLTPVQLEKKKQRQERQRQKMVARQLQDRKRRRMIDHRMRFGMSTPKGTPPRQYLTGEPIFQPMPAPGFSSFGWLLGLISLLPWFGMRRRRREAEIAEQQKIQSIKAKAR
jgi:hypothetical protein